MGVAVMRNPTEGERRSLAEPMRVLLVDDDAGLRAIVAEALRAEGSEVVEAANGAQAFDTVAAAMRMDPQRYFALVISDVQMPGCGGLELLGLLRLVRYRAPVILLSGLVDARLRARARRLGAAGILAKPFDVKILQMIVQGVITHPWWRADR